VVVEQTTLLTEAQQRQNKVVRSSKMVWTGSRPAGRQVIAASAPAGAAASSVLAALPASSAGARARTVEASSAVHTRVLANDIRAPQAPARAASTTNVANSILLRR